MKRLALLCSLVAGCAFAGDVLFKVDNANIAPVLSINLVKDGGLTGHRDAGAVAHLECAVANASSRGCVSPGAQNFGTGDKTFGGAVITPLVDAGVAAIGSLDLRGSSVTNTDTASTLLIQSNASDTTTSSTVGSVTLKAGADVTATDAILAVQDSAGNNRLRVQEQGYLNFVRVVTDDGALGAIGTTFTIAPGVGGAATGATPGGLGGSISLTPAAGGASNGTAAGGMGGIVTIASGTGGAESGSAAGGRGGEIGLYSGAGKPGSSGGGYIFFYPGNGAAATSSLAASQGGALEGTCGTGGAASSFSTTAAPGGRIDLRAGAGGTSAVGETSGVGGDLTLMSGAGGATTGGTGARGGTVTIDTGVATGAATPASIGIGTSNAGSITIGRAGRTTQLAGALGVTQASTLAGGVTVGSSGNAISAHYSATASLDFTALAANSCEVLTVAVLNAADGDTCSVGVPNALADVDGATERTTFFCWVSAAGTASVRRCNHTGSATADPAAATVRADVWKH